MDKGKVKFYNREKNTVLLPVMMARITSSTSQEYLVKQNLTMKMQLNLK